MFKVLFNTILGLGLIFVWLRFVDLPQIISTLSKVNLFYILPVFLSLLLSPVLRAIRLKIFLSGIPVKDWPSSGREKIDLKDLIYLNGAAWMLNFLIPIRAGELAKGIYLNTKYDLPLGKSVIWIFLDRFVDFLAVLILAGVLLLIIPTTLSITIIKFITIIMVILILLVFLSLRVLQPQMGRLPRVLRTLVMTGFDSFSILKRHPKDLIKMFGITVLAYGADALVWYFSFLALGASQDFLKMYLGQLLSALTYLIPAAPGYVGSAEASGLLILSGVFGINTNLASATTVLFHILSAIFVIAFGLVSIFSLQIDLGLILKKALKRS